MKISDILSGQNLENQTQNKSLICSKACIFYKNCVENLLLLNKEEFIDFYIMFKNSFDKENWTILKVNEYIENKFPNKEIFFSESISQIKKYYIENKLSDEQDSLIKSLLKDPEFLSYISKYIRQNNSNLLNNSQIELFEEINFLLYLSWIDKNYDISSDKIFSHKNIEDFNSSAIVELFDSYNNIITYFYDLNDYKSVDNIISLLINLFDIVNNSIFVSNIVFSWKFEISFITQTLQNIIQKLIDLFDTNPNLSESINLLKNSYWKLDIIFTNIKTKDETEKDVEAWNLENILNSYNNILSKHIEGFYMMKESKFWNWRIPERNAYNVFLWNSSVAILELIDLLKFFPEEIILENTIFNEIIDKYSKFILNKKNYNFNLESLKFDLLHNIYLIYSSDDIKEDWICGIKQEFLVRFLDDFLSKDNLNQDEIESLYHIVRFSDIDIIFILELWEHLIKNTFSSYYYEEFKIKTLSVIIKLFSTKNINRTSNFINKLLNYIESNKVCSHLIQSYSDIYLYTSLYYSHSIDPNIKEKSKDYYYKFKQIKWDNLDSYDLDIKNVISEIEYNLWYSQAEKYWIINNIKEDKINILNIGKTLLEQWESSYYDKLDNIISDKISLVISKNLNWFFADFDLWTEIVNILSNYVFKWVCNISIIDNSKEAYKTKKSYNYREENLYENYKIIFEYPIIHENIFLDIFEKEWTRVLTNIKTIIITNIQKKELEYDKTTWFLNEAKFLSDLEKTNSQKTSVMILRLNNIGYINKWYSHELGDKYLSEISKLLQKKLSPIVNTFYRWNWANFILNLKNWLEKETIEKYFTEFSNEKVFVNWVSFSTNCLFWAVLDDVWDIHKKAMISIDTAKRNKEKSCFFDETLINSENYKKNMEILYSVEEAIKDWRIVPYFQPIMDLKKMEVYKYEVLVRMIDKNTGKAIPPWLFLDVIKDHWKLGDITRIILDKSFEIIKYKKNPFSINITADDFKNPTFLAFIDSLIQKYCIDPSLITLELLESSFDWNIIPILEKLKNRWFKIAMDDYGADYSNLNRFIELTKHWLLDYLKIDWTVIKALAEDKNWAISSFLLWIIEACHKSWVKVVAEFVENEKLITKLADLKIDFWQWYFYSAPFNEEWLKNFWH